MHADLASAYEQAGLLREAIHEFQRALALCPSYVDIRTRLGAAYRSVGDLPAADARVRAGEEGKPQAGGPAAAAGDDLLRRRQARRRRPRVEGGDGSCSRTTSSPRCTWGWWAGRWRNPGQRGRVGTRQRLRRQTEAGPRRLSPQPAVAHSPPWPSSAQPRHLLRRGDPRLPARRARASTPTSGSRSGGSPRPRRSSGWRGRWGCRTADMGYAGHEGPPRHHPAVPQRAGRRRRRRRPAVADEGLQRAPRRARHGNKLRMGHLRGNRFEVVLERAGARARPRRCEARLRRWAATGCPTASASSASGRRATTWRVALAILRGRAARARPPAARSCCCRRCSRRCSTARWTCARGPGACCGCAAGDVLQKRDIGRPVHHRRSAARRGSGSTPASWCPPGRCRATGRRSRPEGTEARAPGGRGAGRRWGSRREELARGGTRPARRPARRWWCPSTLGDPAVRARGAGPPAPALLPALRQLRHRGGRGALAVTGIRREPASRDLSRSDSRSRRAHARLPAPQPLDRRENPCGSPNGCSLSPCSVPNGCCGCSSCCRSCRSR